MDAPMSEHAHKPKPKSVAQAPTQKVAPTSNPRPLGIQRKPTIAPAKPAATAPDQKAGSWVHPSSKPGSHLVGQIFFRTKDSTIDAHDRTLLAGLAHAYAGNKQKPVKGTFEGFADPRPSHHPENVDLSQARAGAVAREVVHAFANTNAWYENVAAAGRGVDPAAAMIEADEGFEDIHAPYRRVDVYLDGKAAEEVVGQNVVADDRPKPPDYSDRPQQFQADHYQIERGDKDYIEGVALKILANTAFDGADDQLDATLRGMGVYVSVDGQPRELPKPPWWDSRAPAPVHGRGGFRRRDNHGFDEQDTRPEYVRRASQLVQDYQLYLNYRTDRQGDMRAVSNSGFKDLRRLPDGKNIEERLGYLRFMINAINDEAEAVWKLSK